MTERQSTIFIVVLGSLIALLMMVIPLGAQTQMGPIRTPQVNTQLFVGEGAYLSIQTTLNFACRSGQAPGFGWMVIILPGVNPSDSPTNVNGCAAARIRDERVSPAQYYVWNGTNYSAVPYPGGGGNGGTGVSQIVAGNGINISPSTGIGAVTISTTNGGGGGAVNRIIAGSNILISPTTGTGDVTISATGGGGGPAGSWSNLSAPAADLILNHGSYNTVFNYTNNWTPAANPSLTSPWKLNGSGINFDSEIQHLYQRPPWWSFNANLTDQFDIGMAVPPTSTAFQADALGIFFTCGNNLPSTYCVGNYIQGRTTSSGAPLHGLNINVSDDGLPVQFIVGEEINTQVFNAGTIGSALSILPNVMAPGAPMDGLEVKTNIGTLRYPIIVDGDAGALGGIKLGRVTGFDRHSGAPSNTQLPIGNSLPIDMDSTAGTGRFFYDTQGTFQFNSPIAAPNISNRPPTLAPAPAAADTFQRAAGQLGSNWATSDNNIQIVSSGLVGTPSGTTSANSWAWFTALTFNTSQCSTVFVQAGPAINSWLGVSVNQTDASNFYSLQVFNVTTTAFANTAWNLSKTVGGTTSLLSTGNFGFDSIGLGDKITLCNNNGTLTGYRNEAQIVGVGDPTLQNGHPGFGFPQQTTARIMDWQGGAVYAATLTTDAFQRAAGPLGSSWTGDSTVVITAPGTVGSTSGSANAYVWYNAQTFDNNQCSSVTLSAMPISNQWVGAFTNVSGAGSANNFYGLLSFNMAGNYFQINRMLNGTATTLVSNGQFTTPMAVGDVYRLCNFNGYLIVYKNGAPQGFTQDTGVTGGYPGFGMVEGDSTRITSWTGQSQPIQTGTDSGAVTIGGAPLAVGCTDSTPIPVGGATTAMACVMSSVGAMPANVQASCSVTGPSVVTPRLCAFVATTPPSQDYNIRVIP